MTAQDSMKAKLAASGIPFREIECYGSQIVITSASESAAIKWAGLLSSFSKVRQPAFKTIDESVSKKGTYVDVWRTFARIA